MLPRNTHLVDLALGVAEHSAFFHLGNRLNRRLDFTEVDPVTPDLDLRVQTPLVD